MARLTVRASNVAFHVAKIVTGPPLVLRQGWPEFWLSRAPAMTRLADRCTRASAGQPAMKEVRIRDERVGPPDATKH